MTKLVRAGVFVPLYLCGEGRAFFSREAVLAAETSGKVFRLEKVKPVPLAIPPKHVANKAAPRPQPRKRR